MSDNVTAEIVSNLDTVSSEHSATIILAIESGSRAWGFESIDSDYDVRFIYAKSTENYLRISPERDVIELPIVNDLDINGWDLKKTIGLLLKSNPPVLEWLSSPIMYIEHPAARILRTGAQEFFNPVNTSYHYLSMAKQNYKHLQADLVPRKKYLYVLRPLFCIEWIQENGTMPPMKFNELRNSAPTHLNDSNLVAAIDQLLLQKMKGMETDKQPIDTLLDAYIRRRLDYYDTHTFGQAKPPDYDLADQTFRKVLNEIST